MSTTSLGDISIKSNVESNLFIVSTTTLIPRKYENSLYTVFPVTLLLKEIGDVRSVTKFVWLVIVSEPNFQLYSGVNVSYSEVVEFQIWNCPRSASFSITR